MAGRYMTGDRLSEETKKEKINASVQKELDHGIGKSSESPSSLDEKGGLKSAGINASSKAGFLEDLDLMQESLIERAVERFLEEDADELSDGGNIPRTFSQEYEARKQKMLQTAFDWDESESMAKTKRRFRIPSAAAAVVALLVVTASLSVVRADAMPEPIRVIVMQVQSLFSSTSLNERIRYGDNQAVDMPTTIRTFYEPTVVLDGYEEIERIHQGDFYVIYYINDAELEYGFWQYPIGIGAGFDTEGTVYEEVEVNGNNGIMYVNKGQRYLQWQQEGYAFELSGDLEVETLKELAASVRPMED